MEPILVCGVWDTSVLKLGETLIAGEPPIYQGMRF